MQHIIKKQMVELTISNRKHAFRLQQLVSEHYWRDMVRVIAKAFDEATGEEEILQVDKLEIDLGRISEKDIMKGRWTEVLFKKITEKLKELKHAPVPGMNVSIVLNAIGVADQWLFYMLRGFLPWNVKAIDLKWHVQVLQAFATEHAAIVKLRNAILNHPNMVTRIVRQHGEDFVVALLEAITAKDQKELPEVVDELIKVICFLEEENQVRSTSKAYHLKERLWQQVLLLAARRQGRFTRREFVETLFRSGYIPLRAEIVLPIELLTSGRLTGEILGELLSIQSRKQEGGEETESAGSTEVEDENSVKKKMKKTDPADGKSDLGLESIYGKDSPENMDRKGLNDPGHLRDEAIYVQHAGVILLHSFLKPFFHNLGLLNKNYFIDAQSRERAVFLIYFLATGKLKAEEHELVIEKLLCGYPLQMPVHREVVLNDNEIREAAELLGNVIRHWKILKNTSVDGLRESFLLRPGKLGDGKDGPVLQVERSSIDVLLDDIPWNYTLIQLAWRKDLIRVEW
ncbi:MAG: hypothetical protein H7Y42_04150 [Chitinophagaceae bacterium]|nr:hypothetical protein [Chitinophagaceae bacterium]